ncbi:hypothetical protein [Photobacterium kishitanii]|uniref:Uncharacterized protein n=1 Tax=Photobacterium kishitanii TaxID=318456 RepID=A0A2T3KLK0_9GAMM|nr:hypothetical protein [Photobacterium kishitanii]PSV00517.1 hypothetical protein C9J27_05125 [Photobacterium kishitanii]
MLFDGKEFRKNKMVITLPSDWKDNNAIFPNNSVRFAKICKANSRGAVQTHWLRDSEHLFAKPILNLRFVSSNMAYGTGEDLGKVFMFRGGVIYSAKCQVSASSLKDDFVRAFTNSDGLSLVADYKITLSYPKSEGILIVTRQKEDDEVCEVKAFYLADDHPLKADVAKVFKLLGKLMSLDDDSKAKKATAVLDNIFSIGGCGDLGADCHSIEDLSKQYNSGAIFDLVNYKISNSSEFSDHFGLMLGLNANTLEKIFDGEEYELRQEYSIVYS